MNTYTDRFTTLAVDSAQTMLDGAYAIQRQNAGFIQSWLNTLEASREANRELVGTMVRNAQEFQTLWFQFAQESVRRNIDTATRFGQESLKDVSENLSKVNREAGNGSKKVEVPTK